MMVCLDFGGSDHPTQNVAYFLVYAKLGLDWNRCFPFSLCPSYIQTTSVCSRRNEDPHWSRIWQFLFGSNVGSYGFLMMKLDCQMLTYPFNQPRSLSHFPEKNNGNESAGERGCVSLHSPCLSITVFSVENHFI